VMNLAREAVRRKPLGHGVGIEKCPIDPLGLATKNAVKTDGARHDSLLMLVASPIVDWDLAKSTGGQAKGGRQTPAVSRQTS
jgi:hypothetical protein